MRSRRSGQQGRCDLLVSTRPVPESVSRSISTSSARNSNRLYPAAARAATRSARVVSRIGSTEWIRNGSMIVRNGSSAIDGPP